MIDRIDALVNEQLAGYPERSGYDYNVGQIRCPRWECSEEFHGLPITFRMWQMRQNGMFDPEYRYGEDTSPVICPGSLFIGPVQDWRGNKVSVNIWNGDWEHIGTVEGAPWVPVPMREGTLMIPAIMMHRWLPGDAPEYHYQEMFADHDSPFGFLEEFTDRVVSIEMRLENVSPELFGLLHGEEL